MTAHPRLFEPLSAGRGRCEIQFVRTAIGEQFGRPWPPSLASRDGGKPGTRNG